MAEYTETFAQFILECKATYDDLCAMIDAGDVEEGKQAKVTITITSTMVEQIRHERLAEVNGNG